MREPGGRQRRLRRLAATSSLLALLATAAAATIPVPAHAAPAWHTWVGQASNVYRDAQYDRGEWIYSNGILQAQGANSDGIHRQNYFTDPSNGTQTIPRDVYLALTYDFFGAHRATHNGDYQLPTDTSQWPAFTADLAEMRLAVDGNQLSIRLLWNSMPRPDAQIATITLATVGAAPSTQAWPLNAGVQSPWQRAVTLWGTGGAVNTPSTSQTLAAAGGEVRTGDHVTEAHLPLASLPPGPWVLTGGSGLDDPAATGHYWTVPSGFATATMPGTGSLLPAPGSNVWDLLFAGETPWTFDELKQADDLKTGSVGSDSATVDPAVLTAGATIPAPLRTGDFSRFFSSRVFSADGFSVSGNTSAIQPPVGFVPPLPTDGFNVNWQYTGRLQPYYMHVPATYPSRGSPSPLIVYLHGFTGLPDEPFYNPVGLVQMADQQGYILASALGRGDYNYQKQGDVDVQEVIADVQAHYNVDPNRIYLMGHSMGGYGTDNVGIHHPDLFAALAPAEGTDSIPLHKNLLNTPWFVMTADEDLDFMGTNANQLYSDLSADGYDATVLQYHMKIHEYSSIYDTLPRLFAYFASHTRDPNPPVVSYSRLPKEDIPSIGLVYDHAYWLSGLRAQDPAKPSTTRAESFGLSHAPLDPTHAAVTIDPNDDEHGPDGRGMGVLKKTVPAFGAVGPVRNALRVDTTNDAALNVDLGRVALRLDCALEVTTNGDSAVAVTLTGAGPAALAVSVDGAPQPPVTAAGGAYVIPLAAGAHTAVLGSGTCPTTSGGGGVGQGQGGLPNTAGAALPSGGIPLPLGAAVAAVVLLGRVGRRRRRA